MHFRAEPLLLTDNDLNEAEETIDVGSYNHAFIQANLTFLHKRQGQFTVLTDLSLSVSGVDRTQFDLPPREEIKPDICLYPKRGMNPMQDILKMSEMPLLAIEIVSPRQGLYEITEKFKLYFALGVKSCWLVIPSTQTVTVYAAPNNFQTFVAGEVVDDVVGVQLPLAEIFE